MCAQNQTLAQEGYTNHKSCVFQKRAACLSFEWSVWIRRTTNKINVKQLTLIYVIETFLYSNFYNYLYDFGLSLIKIFIFILYFFLLHYDIYESYIEAYSEIGLALSCRCWAYELTFDHLRYG